MTVSNLLNSSHREQSIRRKTSKSFAFFERSQRSLAGGVSSGLRRSARPYPLFFTSGKGAQVTDVDGNTYIDYGLGWGPLILGHSPEEISDAIAAQAKRSLTFGAQHELEFEVAERLTQIIPCGELVCFANSGTEIVQVALRLARAATGRRKFLKFEGHYHGWDDSVLVSYHPSAADIGSPERVPINVGSGQRAHSDVLISQWNDRDEVELLFAKHAKDISAVICEPILCNSGCIPPAEGFLEFLREITSRYGAVLIFDEVITGFRVELGGAQQRYAVVPDLATYAKAIGGGLPLSVLAGRRKLMDFIANGEVVHAGTLNGNPIALAAALATLERLSRNGAEIYRDIKRNGEKLRQGIEKLLCSAGYPAVTSGEGAVFHVSFMAAPAQRYSDLLTADTQSYSNLVLALLDEGVLALPDGRWYISAAHSEETVDETLKAVARILA